MRIRREIFKCMVVTLVLSFTIAGFNIAQEDKRIIPLSPNMATLQRFIDYPVDHSTGLPNIQIPLYEIRIKDFSFPLTMDFHASGRRGSLDFSPLGVGWSFSAGQASRVVRDRPDERYENIQMTRDSILQRQTLGLEHHYDRLLRADMSIPNATTSEFDKRDALFDIYSFNANGVSGKFIVKNDNSVVMLSHKPYDVTPPTGFGNSEITVTDDVGVVYKFGGNNTSIESTDVGGGYQAVTGWFLTQVILPSGEKIHFKYGTRSTKATGDNISMKQAGYTYVTLGRYPYWNGPYTSSDPQTDRNNYYSSIEGYRPKSNAGYEYDYSITYLKEITFNEGRVVFTYQEPDLRMTACEVFDKNNVTRRKIDFAYMQTPGTSTGLPNNNSYSLASLDFKGTNGISEEKYIFNYYDNALVTSSNPLTFPNYTDWWGYCNSNGNKIPYNPATDPLMSSYGCADCKDAMFTYKLSGMLKKINYPTGGYTEFVYEENRYRNSSGQIKDGPGVRIKEILSDDGSGLNKIIKRYEYGALGDGIGILLRQPFVEDFVSRPEVFECFYNLGSYTFIYAGRYTLNTFSPFPVGGMAAMYNLPVYYPKVTVYNHALSGTSIGKTVYEYSMPSAAYYGSKDYVVHPWKGINLNKRTTYRFRSATNDYTPVEEQSYVYERFRFEKIPQVKLYRNWQLQYEDNQNGRPRERNFVVNGATPPIGSTIGSGVFDYFDYPVEAAIEKPVTELNITYDADGNSINKKIEFFYDNPEHMLPTKVYTTVNNEKTSVEIKYPEDFNIPTSPTSPDVLGIKTLLQKHIISLPIEESHYKLTLTNTNKKLISSRLTTYHSQQPVPHKIFQTELLLPITNFTVATVQSGNLIKDSRYIEKQVFELYDDSLNIRQRRTVGAPPLGYIWDYWGKYPTAEVKNADQVDIAYAGFESNGKGNWVHAGTPVSDASAPSGKRVYNLSSGSMSKGGLTSTRSYLLSYWAKSASATGVSGGTATAMRTKGSWTQYRRVLSGVASVSLSGSVAIDDVRLHPIEASMDSYTYDPLIGITSHTDASGSIVYYEYDTFGRLRLTRDLEGKVTEDYRYNYSN